MTFCKVMTIYKYCLYSIVVEMQHTPEVTPLFTSISKPTCHSRNSGMIAIGLQSDSILLLKEANLKHTSSLLTQTQDRTLSVRVRDNLVARGGNQGIVCLWDIRQGDKPVHSFNRPGCKFRAIDISQHIMAGGTNKRVVFWDLRKMKQRAQFTQSFNEQITGLQFSQSFPTIFHVCAMDGLIAQFDLKQQNQQDAFQWGHQMIESPTKLQLYGNTTFLQTDNQKLITLKGQSVDRQLSVSSVEHPGHIMHSCLDQEMRMCYHVKTMRDGLVKYWVDNYQIGYLPIKHEVSVEMIIPVATEKVIFADSEGKWNYTQVVRGNIKSHQPHNQDFLTVEELEAKEGKKVLPATNQVCNDNGFIVSKPNSLKSHSKKFRPY